MKKVEGKVNKETLGCVTTNLYTANHYDALLRKVVIRNLIHSKTFFSAQVGQKCNFFVQKFDSIEI